MTPTKRVDLDWRNVAFVMAACLAIWVVYEVTLKAPRLVTIVLVSILLSIGLNPLVEIFDRRLHRRPLSLACAFGSMLGVLTLILVFLIPPALNQAADLPQDVRRVSTELRNMPLFGERLEKAKADEKISDALNQLPDRLSGDLSPVRDAARSVADTVGLGSGILLMTLCLLLDGTRFLQRSRRFFPGKSQESYDTGRLIIYESVGRYITGSIAVASIAGLFVLTVGLILGVPLAPLLALWVALWDLIPQIGGAMGGIPFIALGFTQDPLTGLLCAVLFLAYLQVENNIISPIVVGKAIKLSPLVTMLAALLGVGAAGVIGALFAVPLVGAAKALYESRDKLLPSHA